MKIISGTGIIRPSLLVVRYELPALTLHQPWLTTSSTLWLSINHEKGTGFMKKFQCSVANGKFASASVDSSLSKAERVHLGRKQGISSSSYSRPSLSEMKNEMMENRARVYEFLRGIGVIPDELDGLELPVTVEVMRERVDFLHKLGLTIDDIDNYPLVLGCSVKKNMIPVLDYLGKLGGMDIKPNDIPRVLERYPEVLGFKLEGTMSTSVAYLVGIGVAKKRNWRGFNYAPRDFGNASWQGIDLKPKLLSQRSFLDSIIELGPEDFGRVVEKMPQVVSLNNTSVVKHINFLKDSGFSLEQVRKMVVGCPQLLALNLSIMRLSFDYFQTEMGRGLDDLVNFPAFFTYSLESTIKPRHRMVAKKGLKCSLAWLLNCSDQKFAERMDYDFIDVEEAEIDYSFDMNTLMEPRSDESDSDFEDSDDESGHSMGGEGVDLSLANGDLVDDERGFQRGFRWGRGCGVVEVGGRDWPAMEERGWGG
ncbi:mitochondrial transcription termination factor family protein [Actinidia rufa]|uniref:Mitochondrial transcription termination factor family protein n=1 Tax=Actinidia rufa TaxID=165716 RepID=A0A7J0EZY8_9ERIC|nr:mitochondrial transcription termination factor family protein [Actinidia rufa]